MENIVNTNNTNLRLCELRVGLFNTLRVSLPMVSPDATNVQVLLTNGTITTAYSATKNTDGVWLCDVDAAQFSAFGKQKYEVAYKLYNKQFWDGQGWVNIVPATTSGIVPQPVPPPHRWAIISITQGDITHYADENGDINLDDITRVRWDNVIDKPDFADVATSGSYNDLEDVPTTFPPEAHTHTKSEITDFPTSMPPTAHSHASDGWFTSALEAVKVWASGAFAAITHSHAGDSWFTTALRGKRDYDDRSWGNLVSGVKANGDSVVIEERDGAHYYKRIPDSIGSDNFTEYQLFLTEATGDEQDELWVYQVRHFINGGSEMDLDVYSVSDGGFIENTITVNGEAGNKTFVKGYYHTDSFALTSDIAEHNESSSAHSDIRTELANKVGKELSGQTFDMSNDADTKRLLSLVGQALGATVTHASTDDSTGASVAMMYGINPTDTTTFGELQTKAGLGDSAVLGDL